MNLTETLKQEIIQVGKRLYARGLAVAKSGNISARLGSRQILITGSQTYLGSLEPKKNCKVLI